jgi:hypothetical protein
MSRSFSLTPAKTRKYRVTFLGPKGGYHHVNFTFKLTQMATSKQDISGPRGTAIMQKMHMEGWNLRVVDWYKSTRNGPYGDPNAYLIYRIHKNDIYNSKLVKPGWKIVGEY